MEYLKITVNYIDNSKQKCAFAALPWSLNTMKSYIPEVILHVEMSGQSVVNFHFPDYLLSLHNLSEDFWSVLFRDFFYILLYIQ